MQKQESKKKKAIFARTTKQIFSKAIVFLCLQSIKKNVTVMFN